MTGRARDTTPAALGAPRQGGAVPSARTQVRVYDSEVVDATAAAKLDRNGNNEHNHTSSRALRRRKMLLRTVAAAGVLWRCEAGATTKDGEAQPTT